MPRPRKGICIVGALAAIAVPSLSGCASPPGAARAQAGMFGELFEQLKREDDEAEAREWAAMRQAAREQNEAENTPEVEWH
jgi:hypothetical protein